MGLCVLGLEGPHHGCRFGVRENETFESASLIKLLILAELLRRVDRGEAHLGEKLQVERKDIVPDSEMIEAHEVPCSLSVERLAGGMITVSDNTATNLLMKRLGAGEVNALARELGLGNTTLGREMMDFDARSRGEDNFTSASDMALLLEKIWHGELLCAGSRTFALEMLKHQRITSRVPMVLPHGAHFAHKTGDLEGVENDAGIVILPGRSYVLVVLTKGDLEKAYPLLEQVTAAVAEAFSETLPL